ncbi:MAG: hypothetical protein KDE53_36625 [Caldilineaceae bacterium]|nr:hypothetical protein [Caldilineaceae bacterium]
MRQQSAGDVPVVAGTYSGNVVVKEPAPLGGLTLVLGISNTDGTLAGKVDDTQTMVFLGGPSFIGSVTASTGVTPTFRIDSESFTGVISGRTVQRKFTLIGEVLDDGDMLQGSYQESITGFTPKPMLVKGTFLLVRPSGSSVLLTH